MIMPIAQLLRPRLSLCNGITTLAGACLFPAPPEWHLLLLAFGGVTLLAMGGSALNQVLEHDLDALMERTRQRPLPQKRLSVAAATLTGCAATLAGLLLLAMSKDPTPCLLGLGALAWYLAVYTPLKRRTTLALPLGALCGAFPPVIGWVLAGGAPADYRVIILAGTIFIWQIPHFWLILERHADDYRRVGMPVITCRGSGFLRSVWLVALAAAALLLPALGGIDRRIAPCFLAISLLPLLVAIPRYANVRLRMLSLFPPMAAFLLLTQRFL